MSEYRVIGLHGALDAAKTPARSEPIIESEDGRPVQVLADGTLDIAEGGSASRDDEHATFFAPLAHHPSWIVLLLGPEDLDALGASEDADARSVTAGSASDRWAAVEHGECLVVYADPGTATKLWQVCRDAIRERVHRAAGRDELAELRRQGWRLQRAALTREDDLDALAALCRAGDPLWREALRALTWQSPEGALTEVERRADSLPRPRYPNLSPARDKLRSAMGLPKRKAA